MPCLVLVSRSFYSSCFPCRKYLGANHLSDSQKTVTVMKENHSSTPKGKLSSADPFFSLSLSFLPHHEAAAVKESIMALCIRSRNITHLSIKVDNVTAFTVADLNNKIMHKLRKGYNLLRKGDGEA